ncbi:MAG: hypothetical protein WBM86_18320, partial [Waterburya sp.]
PTNHHKSHLTVTHAIQSLQHSIRVVNKHRLMEEILFWIISTLLAWAIERSADAMLDLIIEWLKRRLS